MPSSPHQHSEHKSTDMSIEHALAGHRRRLDDARCTPTTSATMEKTLQEAMTTGYTGLKVIIADGECQLERQRRIRPADRRQLAEGGERVVRARYGVDEDTCTGDHSCIRLSGCPSLTVKDNPDPLRARSGGAREQRLRRLRPVRRGRARGGAVPVVLPRRDRAEPALARPRAARVRRLHRLAAAGGSAAPRRSLPADPRVRSRC